MPRILSLVKSVARAFLAVVLLAGFLMVLLPLAAVEWVLRGDE